MIEADANAGADGGRVQGDGLNVDVCWVGGVSDEAVVELHRLGELVVGDEAGGEVSDTTVYGPLVGLKPSHFFTGDFVHAIAEHGRDEGDGGGQGQSLADCAKRLEGLEFLLNRFGLAQVHAHSASRNPMRCWVPPAS